MKLLFADFIYIARKSKRVSKTIRINEILVSRLNKRYTKNQYVFIVTVTN